MTLLTKLANYQHEISAFFYDLFKKHSLSTMSDVYVPPPILLASSVSWALGFWSWRALAATGNPMAAAEVTHLCVAPTFSVSPSEC